MARPIRGCPTLWLQQYGTVEPERIAGILSQEELEDIEVDKVVRGYNPKGSDPSEEPDDQEKKADSKAVYANMELPEMEL